MPIFDFKCRSCGNVSEFLLDAGSDEDSVRCPECGSVDVEKVLSAPGGVRVGDGSSQYGGEEGACCGMTNPCENPKRCCTKR